MINIRTKEELALLRESGRLLAEVKQIIWDAIKPGISTKELDDIAYNEIIARNSKPAFKGYGGFPGSACISVNDEMIHGIPGKRIIKEGDLVKVDLGLIWKGYYSDSAFTKGVGQITPEDQKLIDVAKGAFYAGVDAIKPGVRLGDVEFAIGQFVHKHKMHVPVQYSGHGVGTALHEEPFVHNQGTPGTGPLLKDGMVLAIEPMILQTSEKVKVLSDKWTVVSKDGKNTAHYEHTIAIIDGRVEILTEGI